MTDISQEQIERYCSRIGLTGPLPPTAETLSAIQWAHLHTVPFENLDINPLGRPFSLDIPDIYDKIVNRRRGGFCFELNGLLAVLLETLGYQVSRMGAWFADDPDPNPLDHLVLDVTVPGDGSRWYADVGAGRTNPERAIPIDGLSADGQRRSRLGQNGRVVEKIGADGDWELILTWGLTPHALPAFLPRCRYFQTAADSHFRQSPVCTMLVPGGRITLSKRTLITTINGDRTERALTSNAEIAEVLRSTFGIEIPVDDRWG